MIERMSRNDWLSQNPIFKQYVISNPHDWFMAPAFNLWPDASQIEGISDHQRENLTKALAGRIGILGGSPGTGKTYTVAKLIRYMLSTGLIADYEIGIGAPTGKAAVRLTENLNKNGLELRARTWHSMLGIGANSETGGWSFAHNESNPLPYRVLIGDEMSMMDLSLMIAVFKARAFGCHFLIVGDVNQLPPVGNGAPLRDMILAGLLYGELTEIQRNSGGIVEACAAIRDGKPWAAFTKAKGTNLTITGDESPDDKIESIKDALAQASEQGLNPIWDCQVLTALNESSPLSRTALNEVLQDHLNVSGKHPGSRFRIGDKIVCLKNGFYKNAEQQSREDSDEVRKNDKGEIYVANGELAEVVQITDSEVFSRLDFPARVVSVPIRKQSSDDSESESDSPKSAGIGNWDLGYALSVHKSQGSEWPVVIGVLDNSGGARMVCDRAWIYTLISRAKDKCRLIGDQNLADRFCRVAKIRQRKTFLKELIGIELFKQEAKDL